MSYQRDSGMNLRLELGGSNSNSSHKVDGSFGNDESLNDESDRTWGSHQDEETLVDDIQQNDFDEDSSSHASLSSSVYEDFPQLFFAVRKGRYVCNTIFPSWEKARRQILGCPEAEYIATPTYLQAQIYLNAFAGSQQSDPFLASLPNPMNSWGKLPLGNRNAATKRKQDETSSKKIPSNSRRNRKRNKKRFGSKTRKLVLEYYRSIAMARSCHTEDAPRETTHSIAQFLKARGVYETKFQIVVKFWQRSGLMTMSRSGETLQEATKQYDRWFQANFTKSQESVSGTENDTTASSRNRKRKRPIAKKAAMGVREDHAPEESLPIKRSNKGSTSKPRTKDPQQASDKNSKKKPGPISKESPIPESVIAAATISPEFTKTTIFPIRDDEDDDNDETWNQSYEKLKAFHDEHGHCRVPKTHDPDLHYWVSYNRRRMRPESKKSGARNLTFREEKLLNDLGLNPSYKETVAEFQRYVGVRVAKLFEVVKDVSDNASSDESSAYSYGIETEYRNGGKQIVKTKPFFGTVRRISSVSNRYMFVEYDDGDSEDYDEEGLLEGLDLYQLYKDKDIRERKNLPRDFDAPTPTSKAHQSETIYPTETLDSSSAIENSENPVVEQNNHHLTTFHGDPVRQGGPGFVSGAENAMIDRVLRDMNQGEHETQSIEKPTSDTTCALKNTGGSEARQTTRNDVGSRQAEDYGNKQKMVVLTRLEREIQTIPPKNTVEIGTRIERKYGKISQNHFYGNKTANCSINEDTSTSNTQAMDNNESNESDSSVEVLSGMYPFRENHSMF